MTKSQNAKMNRLRRRIAQQRKLLEVYQVEATDDRLEQQKRLVLSLEADLIILHNQTSTNSQLINPVIK